MRKQGSVARALEQQGTLRFLCEFERQHQQQHGRPWIHSQRLRLASSWKERFEIDAERLRGDCKKPYWIWVLWLA